jgi:DNA-binding IclR family transcriptional regulator
MTDVFINSLTFGVLVEKLLQKKLKRYTSKTIIDPASLLDRLQKIKKQGYVLSVEELHKGVSSISAPIYNLKGNVIASVTIAGPVQRMNNNMTSNLIKSVIQSANEISQLLHYR